MDETPYSFSSNPVNVEYTFASVSQAKTVEKVVRFTETNLPNIFNLALLDQLGDGQESDLSVTNNDDLKTVLATVMQIVHAFLTKFPNKIVTFTGSDARRIRLYRIVISREIDVIRRQYSVFGLIDGRFEEFQPNVAYEQFFLNLKL